MSEASLSALFLQNPQLAIALRRQMEAQGQIKEGTSSDPIRSPWQGVNRLANALIGGYEYRKADEAIRERTEAEESETASFQQSMADALLRRGQPSQATPAPTPPTSAVEGGAQRAMAGGRDVPIAATMLDPYAKALLLGIYGAESPGYNVRYGGSTFDSFADHPRTRVPIMSGPMKGQYSTAAGRPQFLAGTWDEVKTKYNLPDFSPASQDMGAWHLARDTYQKTTGRDLLADLKSNDPSVRVGITNALRGVWPSLPGGDQPNSATNGFWGRFDQAMRGTAAPQEATMGAPSLAQPQGAPGIPLRPEAQNSALMDIYTRGIASKNPRVRAMAQGLAPFITQQAPAATTQEIPLGNGMMQKVISYDQGRSWQNVGVAYDPSGKNTLRTPEVMDQERQLRGPTTVSPNSTVLDPVTNQPIFTAPPAPPSTFEEAAARGMSSPQGQSPTEFRSGQTQATEAAQAVQKDWQEQGQRGSAAAARLPLYDRVLAGLDKMPPGALLDTRMRLAGVAQELGIDLGGNFANVSEGQLRQSIQRQLELAFTPKGQGQITENERKLLREQIDIMLSTPEGTKQILALARANDKRDMDLSGIYRKYADQSGVIRDIGALRAELSDYNSRAPWQGLIMPPPEAPQQQARPGQRQVIANPADAMKLPPGTEFQTPDGRILRVPAR